MTRRIVVVLASLVITVLMVLASAAIFLVTADLGSLAQRAATAALDRKVSIGSLRIRLDRLPVV